jgi:uncharacterized repeat protein (TIGR03803 family)
MKTPGNILKLLPLLLALIARAAPADVSFTTLVTFDGTNGAHPQGGLIQASDGYLYGTTDSGGTNGGHGTVFRLSHSGTFTTLASFSGTNGSGPRRLTPGSDGNFYGITHRVANNPPLGGTIFKMTPSGALTTLVAFDGTNGFSPEAALIQSTNGNFRGTTAILSEVSRDFGFYRYSGNGTIFEMTPSGALTNLLTFNGANGAAPLPGLIQATDGNYYGTTAAGDSHYPGLGTIFKMTPSGTLTTMVIFHGTNGSGPGELLQANDGNFYGTTEYGGPLYGTPVEFYKTHVHGYTNAYGTIFKMTPAGRLFPLVAFDGTNGFYPESRLIQAADGNLYGTTKDGTEPQSRGKVFKMTPWGQFIILIAFDGVNGACPCNGLVQGSDGNLYGTTLAGGKYDQGTIYRITTAFKKR